VNVEQVYELLWERSQPMLEFKRRELSLVHGKSPVLELGPVNVKMIQGAVKSRDVLNEFPGRSRGFANMSEIWISGDFKREKKFIELLAKPVLDAARAAVTAALGRPAKIFKAVVDTIDENSCILPHSDDYFHHSLALRVHAPLFTSPGSIGVNWHPETLVPQFWRMPEVGKLYAFNNFEPHTVVKLDAGKRAHLICDVVVGDLFDGIPNNENLQIALNGQGPGATSTFNPNLVTHNIGNLALRNQLGAKYGQMDAVGSLQEQCAEEYIQRTLSWLKDLAKHASV
jgi:hypothetical protein